MIDTIGSDKVPRSTLNRLTFSSADHTRSRCSRNDSATSHGSALRFLCSWLLPKTASDGATAKKVLATTLVKWLKRNGPPFNLPYWLSSAKKAAMRTLGNGPQWLNCSCHVVWIKFTLPTNQIKLKFSRFYGSVFVDSWSHRTRLRAVARSFRISSSSYSLYIPISRVWRRNELSMIFVRASATCAPL